jgi:hypothetical protein
MMNILKLTLIQLRINFGLSALRWYMKHDLKKFLGAIGIAALIIFSLGPVFFPLPEATPGRIPGHCGNGSA